MPLSQRDSPFQRKGRCYKASQSFLKSSVLKLNKPFLSILTVFFIEEVSHVEVTALGGDRNGTATQYT